MSDEELQDRIRQICLALPDAVETITWGEPHFRVNNKIFAGMGEEKGKLAVGFKLTMDHAADMVQVPGFWKAPYVGHKGWVSMDLREVGDWEMVADLLLESYTLIAPKRSLAKLANDSSKAKTRSPRSTKKKASQKTTRAVAKRKPVEKRTAKKKTVKKKTTKKKVAKIKTAQKKTTKKKSAKKKVGARKSASKKAARKKKIARPKRTR